MDLLYFAGLGLMFGLGCFLGRISPRSALPEADDRSEFQRYLDECIEDIEAGEPGFSTVSRYLITPYGTNLVLDDQQLSRVARAFRKRKALEQAQDFVKQLTDGDPS